MSAQRSDHTLCLIRISLLSLLVQPAAAPDPTMTDPLFTYHRQRKQWERITHASHPGRVSVASATHKQLSSNQHADHIDTTEDLRKHLNMVRNREGLSS